MKDPILGPDTVFKKLKETVFFKNLKLSYELLKERRVPFWLKAAAVGVSYIIIVIPDLPGPFDDAGLIYLVSYYFIQLCPQDVVKEIASRSSSTKGR